MAIDRETTAFTRAVAAEIRGYLAREGINQTEVSVHLSRSQGYVSERLNGIRPFDLDDIDKIAQLMGYDGMAFLRQVALRAEEALAAKPRDQLSERRGRMRAGQELPHAAYDSDDGISDEATEHDFEP